MRLLLPALLFFACALPAAADPATQTTSSPPKKLTLAQALAAAPPTNGLLLTVSAEQVTLPDGTEPPAADAGVSDIAAAFGDQTVSFDAVTAIAPSTMAILNTQPDAPNLDADLSPMTALNMLAASLDDRQWQALTSEQGLGLTDLTDDTQRGLFHSLFRQKQLWVSSEDPALESVPQEQRPDVRNLTDQIDATRIRIGQTAKIYLHDTQGKMIYYHAARSDAADRLHTYRPKTPPLPAEHGVRLKAPVPNTLKPSDLAFDGHILQSLVSIANIKTVGDLVTRIGSKAGLELYADPHYAGRTVTIQGAATTAPAADLLRVVCLCVTGTFRKVGPAYVLTDDLAGVGTRRKHLEEWEDAAFNAGMRLQRQAGAVLLSRRAPAARKLPSFGDALPIRVSPSALAVQSALREVVQDSAARPGLAGLVWEDAGGDGTLGYTPDRRLAFLRSAHADPLDITTQSYLRADDALPLFDDAALDKSLPDQWTEAQNQACIVLLHRLQAAAQNSSRSVLPILMVQQEAFGDSLRASWDDPKQPPPSFRDLTPGADFASREKFLRLTRGRSRIVIRHEPVENDGDTPALARALTDDAKNLPSDGFVLDFRHEEVTQGTAPLDSLVRAVSAENRKVSGKTGEKTVK